MHSDAPFFAGHPAIASWVELIAARAQAQPEHEPLLYSSDGEEIESRLSFAALDRRARAIAAELLRIASPGDRVLLLFQPGLEFVGAVFGCWYAGVVAVPTYPPRVHRGATDRSLTRFEAIRKDALPVAVLTERALAPGLSQVLPAELPLLETDRLTGAGEPPRAIEAHTLAMLQYTSGSTSTPKGVMLTHQQLLANSAVIAGGFGHHGQAHGVIWLPHEHDMGLIGGILQSLYACRRTLLMSPLAFIQEPVRWLRAITAHRGTTSGGPNFAYQLCVDRVSHEDLSGLDLSSWDVAFVGAEPVRPATLEAFAQRFAAVGFRPEAFIPCYGLAESTLMVSTTPKARGLRTLHARRATLGSRRVELAAPEDADAIAIASAGEPVGTELIVVDPESRRPLGPGEVGEVWVRGASVAEGYFGRTTDTTFQGVLEGRSDRYLRTGDLGFLHDGELYLTGRLKDLIIVDGANHFAEDIEAAVDGCHPELRPGSGAAFAVESRDSEGVVLVWETRRGRTKDDPAAIVGAIRSALGRTHGLPLKDVRLVSPGWVPRTQSGKIQRQECRRRYLALAAEERA